MINKFVINEEEINNIPISENNEPHIDLKEQNELALFLNQTAKKNFYTVIKSTAKGISD